MQCEKCGDDTRVVSTYKYNGYVYRIRKCIDCGCKTYTKEAECDMTECLDAFNVKAKMDKRYKREKW